MKHLKFILMMFVAANIALVTSCSKDDEGTDTPVNENPSISLAGDDGNIAADVTLEPAESYTFKLTASENSNTNKNLENLKITRTIAGVPATILDSSFNEKTFGPASWTVNAPNIETTDEWSFTITDKDGKTATTGFTVTTVAPANSTPLATELTGQFYHIQGTLRGAYDLVNGAEKSASDPDTEKDMKNSDLAAADFTGSFQSTTATRFSKVTESYDNIVTVEKAEELYTGGGIPDTEVNSPSAGDTYVAKLRNDEYIVLKIDSVDPDDNTCSCSNTGKIMFTYKKA